MTPPKSCLRHRAVLEKRDRRQKHVESFTLLQKYNRMSFIYYFPAGCAWPTKQPIHHLHWSVRSRRPTVGEHASVVKCHDAFWYDKFVPFFPIASDRILVVVSI